MDASVAVAKIKKGRSEQDVLAEMGIFASQILSSPSQLQVIQAYNALKLEILVLTSKDLDLIFAAASQWIYLSKSRRRCKSAIAALQDLGKQHFGATFTGLPTSFPATLLSPLTNLIREVDTNCIVLWCRDALIGWPFIFIKKNCPYKTNIQRGNYSIIVGCTDAIYSKIIILKICCLQCFSLLISYYISIPSGKPIPPERWYVFHQVPSSTWGSAG